MLILGQGCCISTLIAIVVWYSRPWNSKLSYSMRKSGHTRDLGVRCRVRDGVMFQLPDTGVLYSIGRAFALFTLRRSARIYSILGGTRRADGRAGPVFHRAGSFFITGGTLKDCSNGGAVLRGNPGPFKTTGKPMCSQLLGSSRLGTLLIHWLNESRRLLGSPPRIRCG